jgi:hypothetical protein
MEVDPKLLELLRKNMPQSFAERLSEVQPMPSDTFEKLYAQAQSKEKLEKEGFKPVSSLGLMWIKKDENVNETKNEDRKEESQP